MKTDDRLSPRQVDILDAIAKYTIERGYGPTLRDLGAMVGLLSPSSVAYQLEQLRDAGRVEFDRLKPRSIRLLPASQWQRCPQCEGSGVVGGAR